MSRLLPAGVALAVSTVLVYAGVRHHAFVNFDDPSYITENPMVSAGLSLDGLRWAFTASHAGNWHPLTWLSHMLDVSVWGLDPGGPHLTNLALHVLSTLLLFRFLNRSTERLWPSACVAGLFALHPLHVESVAWIAERKDVLSAFWWMVAINIYAVGPERPSAWRRAALFTTSALALLSKPMAVTLPFTLLLVDVWPLGRWRPLAGADSRLPERLRVLWPVFVMAVATAVVTFIVQRQAGAVQSTETFPLILRLANVPVAYVTYLIKMVWPLGLSPLYPYPESIPVLHVLGATAVLATLTLVAWRLRQRQPVLIVGWAWFVVTLLPVIGLVQVGAQPYADRYTYIPLIGICLMVVWPIADAMQHAAARRLAAVSAVAVGVVLAVLTSRQSQVWADSVTLWTHTVEVTSGNYRAYTNLGFAHARAESAARAEDAYRQALRLKPDYPNARNYLGALLLDRQRPADAEIELRAALAVRPRFVEARNSLGVALASQGRVEEAVREFQTALELSPSFVPARNNLGISLAQLGRLNEAIAAFEESVRQQPRAAEAHLNLATALIDAKRPQDALPHLGQAIRFGQGELRATAQRLMTTIK